MLKGRSMGMGGVNQQCKRQLRSEAEVKKTQKDRAGTNVSTQRKLSLFSPESRKVTPLVSS